MMNFDKDHLTDYRLLNRNEAIIFCQFLLAEKLRHEEDVDKIETLIDHCEQFFDFSVEEEFQYCAVKPAFGETFTLRQDSRRTPEQMIIEINYLKAELDITKIRLNKLEAMLVKFGEIIEAGSD